MYRGYFKVHSAPPTKRKEVNSMKTTRKQYIREQKTICGDSYAEVDFCWITEREHRAGPRGKKQFASSLAQQKRNRERSARLLVQLLNRNRDKLLEKGRTLAAEKGVRLQLCDVSARKF